MRDIHNSQVFFSKLSYQEKVRSVNYHFNFFGKVYEQDQEARSLAIKCNCQKIADLEGQNGMAGLHHLVADHYALKWSENRRCAVRARYLDNYENNDVQGISFVKR